ncbi:hypothetical protein BGZ79_002313 [Entomortierella chlamydospora]|nr:hypothetical protein BGZ79_002313 [Entomortierella chlamydospora]
MSDTAERSPTGNVYGTTYHTPDPSNPKVLIIGAGLGGLTLGILLERAGIDYEIFERARAIRPIGSATGISPNILPLFEQLGLIDELRAIWKEFMSITVYKEMSDGETFEELSKTNNAPIEKLSGYHPVVMSRPGLQNTLLSRVPQHKIHLNKRILDVTQGTDSGVQIRCSDGMSHEGDILVGCDGAYSSVRQAMYRRMKDAGQLPSSDDVDLKVVHMSILGTTNPLDPNVVPFPEDGYGRFHAVLGHEKPYAWRIFETPDNCLCWRIDLQLQSTSFSDNDSFRSTDWGSKSNKKEIKEEWRKFRMPVGSGKTVSLGELIDNTTEENVTKVMLEEKLYTTWYHHRVVLLGDCGVNAMLDAVVLANELYEISNKADYDNITKAFKNYYNERYPRAKSDFDNSNQAASLLAGQSWFDKMLRKFMFHFMPQTLLRITYTKTLAYRPQASFLPKIPYRGTGHVEPQKESKKYKKMMTASHL